MLRRFSPASTALGLVRAKTGTLSGISALSGFAGHGDRRLVFSFLTARVRRLPIVRRLHVTMAEALVDHLRGPPPPSSQEASAPLAR
jgi:D-alanyl-D-alanine carboxypeptidase